jgi:tyrosyl-tRNA synthetase
MAIRRRIGRRRAEFRRCAAAGLYVGPTTCHYKSLFRKGFLGGRGGPTADDDPSTQGVCMQGVAEQLRILKRGVEQIVPEPEFLKKLERSVREGRPLRVKYGIDPTGIDVHLGHTVPLRKLRQFQDLGHTAVIIIGNYTAMVGDPSGRDETRARLTREQVEANARDYLAQVGRIIDLTVAEVHHNGDWFSRWSFLDVLDLMRRMTLGQISAREDFAKRIAEEKPVYLHECLYSLMQGRDSVEIRADVELGGTEQLFSLLVARDLQQAEGQEPQVALTMPILVGTDGVRRMGKSLGNYIGVAEPAENQFGKVMSVPDEPMRQYFTLLTELPLEEVDRLLAPGVNPRDAKEVLGKAIVAQYHGAESADRAAAEFRRRAAGEDPEEIPDVPLDRAKLDAENRIPAFVLLRELGLETSGANARRVIEQGGMTVGPERRAIADFKELIVVSDGLIVRVGKRKIVRVKLVGR